MKNFKDNDYQEISIESSKSNNKKENIYYEDNLKYYTTLYKLPKYLEKVIIIYFIFRCSVFFILIYYYIIF